MPHYLKYMLTAYLGFPEQSVEVITPDTGGGFGMKAHVYPEEMLLPLLARELGRPVKWIEDRRENLIAGAHAHEQYVDIAYALDSDGKITGVRTDALGDGGAYHMPPWSMAVEPWCAAVMTPTGIYDVPVAAYTYKAAATNKTPIGAYRGVGYMAGTFARECLADDAARALGMSPFEWACRHSSFGDTTSCASSRGPTRRASCIRRGAGCRRSTHSRRWLITRPSCVDRPKCANRVATSGWAGEQRREHGHEPRARARRHLPRHCHSAAKPQRNRQRDDRFVGAGTGIGLSAQGQGLATTMAQMAADTLGIKVEDVSVQTARSTSHAYGSGTIGSRGAVIAGGAVARAADVVREKVRQVAAHMLEASTDDIELVDGHASVKGVSNSSLSIADVATAIYFDIDSWPEDFEPSLEATQAYDPPRRRTTRHRRCSATAGTRSWSSSMPRLASCASRRSSRSRTAER